MVNDYAQCSLAIHFLQIAAQNSIKHYLQLQALLIVRNYHAKYVANIISIHIVGKIIKRVSSQHLGTARIVIFS